MFVFGGGWAAIGFFLVKSHRKQIFSLTQSYGERIERLERENKNLEIRNNVLIDGKQQLLSRVVELDGEIARGNELLISCERRNERLSTMLEEKEKNLKEISSLKEEMMNKFQAIAHDVAERQKNVLYGEQKKGLGDIVNTLKVQIDDFNRKIQENSKIAQESKISIDEQIRVLLRHTGDIGSRADNLANVLRGDKKVQGNWGELRLRNLLESIGLVAGENFVEQRAVEDRDGKRFIIDFVVSLPNGRELILDSKVSLSNYERYVQEMDEDKKIKFMQKYCEDIRNHIDELEKKKYHELGGLNSLDFVFMFLPIENAYLEAISYDGSLFERAFRSGVALVSGSSLMPVLRMVEYLWSIEKQNKNIVEIVKLSERMYEKVKKLLESVRKLGNDLHNIKKSYDNIVSYISAGKGNILRTANGIKMLAGRDRTMGSIEFDYDADHDDYGEEEADFPENTTTKANILNNS
jgi:DNA recombination protein RmuC